MKAKILKSIFDAGGLTSARVMPVAMEENSWNLAVVTKSGDIETVTNVNTGSQKIYKSYQAAFSDVRRIGFDKAEICFQ